MNSSGYLFLALLLICLTKNVSAQTWSTVGGELNSHIDSLYEFDGKLYLGGNFTNIDGDAA